MMMQPIACVELLLPISDCQKSTSISEDFISTAKILPLSHEYGLGPQAKLIQYLKGEWVKVEVCVLKLWLLYLLWLFLTRILHCQSKSQQTHHK